MLRSKFQGFLVRENLNILKRLEFNIENLTVHFEHGLETICKYTYCVYATHTRPIDT